MTFFKVLLAVNGDILLGTSGTDHCEVPMKGRVCKDVSRIASQRSRPAGGRQAASEAAVSGSAAAVM